jgi:hypothetical protein
MTEVFAACLAAPSASSPTRLREIREHVGTGTDAVAGSGAHSWGTMYARAVDDAAIHLRELRHEEWAGFGSGALAIGLSLAATQVRPALALPLFLGGVVVGVLGARAYWRRWALLDELADKRDAYVLRDVVAYASREATMDRRRTFAAFIRAVVREPGFGCEQRVRGAAGDLHALGMELDDEELELDPAAAVACLRLVSDPALSPLINPVLPPEDLRSRIFQIRSGFSRRGRARAL